MALTADGRVRRPAWRACLLRPRGHALYGHMTTPSRRIATCLYVKLPRVTSPARLTRRQRPQGEELVRFTHRIRCFRGMAIGLFGGEASGSWQRTMTQLTFRRTGFSPTPSSAEGSEWRSTFVASGFRRRSSSAVATRMLRSVRNLSRARGQRPEDPVRGSASGSGLCLDPHANPSLTILDAVPAASARIALTLIAAWAEAGARRGIGNSCLRVDPDRALVAWLVRSRRAVSSCRPEVPDSSP